MIDNELGKNDKTRWLFRKAKFYYGKSLSYGGCQFIKIQALVDGAGTNRWCRTRLLVQVILSGPVVTGARMVAAVVGLVAAGAGR